MEDFECKAPMYFNFSETSALHENDGADKFFECGADDSGNGEDVDNCSVMSEPVNFMMSGSEDAATPVDENVNGILSQAFVNLLTISKQRKTFMYKQHEKDAPNKAVRRTFSSDENAQNRKKISNGQKFVSVAEAVRRFQLGTPDRFHSKPKSLRKQNSDRRRSFATKPSTIPVTPHLTTHLRSRPVAFMTREQEEEKEVAEMKAHQIKANPLNPKILEPRKPRIKVEKKAPTKQVPFNLTELKKKKPEATPTYTFTARPVPVKILERPQGVPEKKELPVTDPVSPNCVRRSKVYATDVDVKDGMKCFMEKEVHHFGIPTAEHIERKRTTEVKPFSFEERDKQLLKKREEAIQKYLEQEKKNREFHAKPLPSCINGAGHKDLTIMSTQPVPFQLSVDKRGMTKQEQLKKKLEEEERALKQMAQFKARPATVILKKPFEPKKADRPLTDITAVELNTEKRAKEREEFDLKVKLEQAELEELRRLRDEEQKKMEMEEIAKFRKEAVHKARPVPKYKPIEVLSSSKPLTSPKSPAFTYRNRSNLST